MAIFEMLCYPLKLVGTETWNKMKSLYSIEI